MSCMYIRWLIFSCNLLSLYPAGYFLSMWLSGIIAIMNSNGDSASPWKIPLWAFASAKLLSVCFGMSRFVCIALPFVDISLIFLLTPVLSGLFPQVVQLFFLCCFCFNILACFRRFFICVSSRISHLGFDFSFVLFERILIFSQTNFALA